MKIKSLAFMASCLTSLALLVPASVGAQAQPSTVVIQGGTLIDGNGGKPITNSIVVIQGNHITAAGRQGQVRAPAGAQVINATGKYIVPGFVDAKSNYASNFGEGYLVWGVTTAVLSGASGDAGIAERDAIDHGVVRGPRLLTSWAAIAANPGFGAADDVSGRSSYWVKTPEQAADMASKFLDAGADFVTAQDGEGPPELYKAMVDEAKRRGKPSVMRVVGPGTAAKELADMGVDVAIHTGEVGVQITTDATAAKWKNYTALPSDEYSDMDDAKARAMAKYLADKHMALEPDLIAMDRGFLKGSGRIREENTKWYDDFMTNSALRAYFPQRQAAGYVENVKAPETYLDPGPLDVRRRGSLNKMRFLKMFVDAGGKLVSASDIPQSPGLGVHQEIAAYVEDVGLTPMQALLAATGWASDAFKQPDIGRIQKGKLADLIILNADPTVNILNTRKIDMVIKDGKVVDRTYKADALAKSFKAGMNEDGSCCFSSPVVEGQQWVTAVKPTYNPNARNGGFGSSSGGFNSLLAPSPAIVQIFPYVIMQNSPATTVKLTGFNYVTGSRVLVDGKPVTTKVMSPTQIEFTLDAAILARGGRPVIRVSNPAPLTTPDFGGTSNPAKITIPYSFTTQSSNNKF